MNVSRTKKILRMLQSLSIDGNLKESIILTRSGNGFIVTRGLDVRQKIKFNDFIIHTSGPGNMTGELLFR